MKQNVYDNEQFHKSYMGMRDGEKGINETVEQPALRSLLPNLAGLSILDLGCGHGKYCKWYVEQGAAQVVGVDISEKMIRAAKETNADPRINYICRPIEELDFPPANFDLVISSFVFHYLPDFDSAVKSIKNWLRAQGVFVFSQDHPILSASQAYRDWVKDDEGTLLYWPVDDYQLEGSRDTQWFGSKVIKYHRTFSTLMNTLLDNGLTIERVLEPTASADTEGFDDTLKRHRRRPPIIVIKSRNIQRD